MIPNPNKSINTVKKIINKLDFLFFIIALPITLENIEKRSVKTKMNHNIPWNHASLTKGNYRGIN
ncbi:MAG: hypothetical protein Kow00108_22470 [Calditrichia bacterium]